MDEAAKLTEKELKAMLDARIRRDAGWKLKGAVLAADLGISGDGAEIDKICQIMYDDIMAGLAYDSDDKMLNATRSVKFSAGYVTRVVKSALKSGTLREEAAVAAAISEAFTEAVKGKPKGKHIGFAALKAKLAARGAKTPAALSAWIGAKKVSGTKKKKGKLSKSAWKTYAKLTKKK